MIYKLASLVTIKAIIIASVVIGVAESKLKDAILVTVVAGMINGLWLLIVARYGTKHVEKKVDEVKDTVEKKVNGNG